MKYILFLLLLNVSVFADKAIIEQFLPSNPIVLEAGAHNGTDTVELAQWAGRVYAFEPVPSLFEQLIRRTYKLPNVFCCQVALSDTTGTAPFYVSSGTSDASSSLLLPKDHLLIHQTVHFNKTITVDTITLDEWADQHAVDHIDGMWLDMQGHEFAMLQASPRILKTVKVIFIEVSYQELYEGTALFPDVRAWLEQQGFVYLCEIMENALFVRKENYPA